MTKAPKLTYRSNGDPLPYRFDIDHGTNDAPPPPRRPSKQQGPSYLWNGTAQKLIEILPEDHPRYRENREMISETIKRWNRGDFK
jgi:hypothetical protein